MEHEHYLQQLTSLVNRSTSHLDLTTHHPRATRRPRSDPASPQPFPIQTEVRSTDRNQVVSWLWDVFLEQSWPLSTFIQASSVLDSFLRVCHVKRHQLQLAAVACTKLVSKLNSDPEDEVQSVSEPVLIEYTDASVTAREIKAWEMLILSKLNWNLRSSLFSTLDFFAPLQALVMARSRTASKDVGRANFELISALACRDIDFKLSAPLACQALAAALIATCQSAREVKEEEKSVVHVTNEDLQSCLDRMETLLWSYLPHPSESPSGSGPGPGSTPPSEVSDNQSPFKITSASTPKSSKSGPLRENTDPCRRRLMLAEAEPASTSEDVGKENRHDDSAIGLNTTAKLSPVSSSTASTASSKHSSPDSGAASTTSAKDMQDLDTLLTSTQLI